MLFENPFFIILLGVIATAIPLMLWYNLGGSKLLMATLGCIVLFSSWLVLERSVETDREALKRTVYDLRNLMRKNDVDGLLAKIEAVELREALEKVRIHHVSACSVSNLSNEPEFDVRENQTFGQIQFIGSATVTSYGRVGPVKVRLEFRKAGEGDWRVVKFEYQLLGDKTNPWIESVPR